jgi:serine/threonine protein kinase
LAPRAAFPPARAAEVRRARAFLLAHRGGKIVAPPRAPWLGRTRSRPMEPDELLANVTEVAGSKVLPPCVIYGRLGRGGMGAVYRARHLNLAIDVAVKVLKPSLVADDPSFVSRFKREGQSAAAISHQNVIRVFDVAEHSGLHYIIMELVVGETARQRVERKGPLPLDEALQILYESAQGLAAAHALGIVHRDVKPDNLLIANTGQLKVADLGLAKPTMGTGGASLMSSANAVMGTPSYMPPEQWESPMVGPAADVWALGTTAWYLLTGADAFDSRDGNFPRVMRQILLQPFPDLKQKRADVPEAVLAVLAKATAKEAPQRYADCGELAAALEGLGLKRVSLRDRSAGGEARTMVSPSPKELDKIKQWLREDFATRMQSTPRSGLGGAPTTGGGGTGAASTPGLAVGSTTPDGTIVTPAPSGPIAMEPAGRKVRWAAIAAGALAVAATVGVWALLRDPPPQPNDPAKQNGARAEQPPSPPPSPNDTTPKDPEKAGPNVEPKPPTVRELAAQQLASGRADAAIDTLRRATPAERGTEGDRDLAKLLGERAAREADGGKFAAALTTLVEAAGFDAARSGDRAALRTRIEVKARSELDRVEPKPSTPVQPGTVTFRGRLPVDGIRELSLGGQKVVLGADGSFQQTLPVERGTTVAVTATLVDDTTIDLGTWPFDVAPPAPVPVPTPAPTLAATAAFAASVPVEAGVAYVQAAAVEVDVEINDPGAELLFRDKRLTPSPGASGKLRLKLELTTADKEQEVALTIVAKKAGVAAVEIPVGRVVYLERNPELGTKPRMSDSTDRFVYEVRAEVDRWTKSVVARLDGKDFELRRLPNVTPPTFAGDVQVRPGSNKIVVRATNRADRFVTVNLDVTCTAAPASIGSVTLVTATGERPLGRNRRCYVNTTENVRLRVEVAGTAVELFANGTKVDGNLVPLPTLTGGKGTLRLSAKNPAPPADEREVEIVFDGTKPTLNVAELKTFALGENVLLIGNIEDDSGIASLTVDQVTVALPTDGKWSYQLPRGASNRTVTVEARDLAGNVTTRAVELKVASAAPVPPPITAGTNEPSTPVTSGNEITFEGFKRADGAPLNARGYPKVIVDVDTGIELVAVPFPEAAKPVLYVGKKLVTEQQFSGAGQAKPRQGLAGYEIQEFLRTRGRGLQLLTESEFDALPEAADVEQLRDGPSEWLKPTSAGEKNWPIRKAGSRTQYDSKNPLSVGFAFRVCYRPQ